MSIPVDNKCGKCSPPICCQYLTQEIDTPATKSDFDHLLWQLSHRNIQLFQEEGSWYLLINNPCTHLLVDGRCGIYDARPEVCRAYENDWCEKDEPAEQHFQRFFDGYYSLLEYCKQRFKKWP
ncbi:YkgJ family cysteine cluster protein [Sedimenticola sp.]|uniref:YkgJ family cysteine cluster protein n=1 Tax=Sedimenticola sp. TaxID=1940285 RepID=UPI003D0F8DF8